jgi:hypothetical protein
MATLNMRLVDEATARHVRRSVAERDMTLSEFLEHLVAFWEASKSKADEVPELEALLRAHGIYRWEG